MEPPGWGLSRRRRPRAPGEHSALLVCPPSRWNRGLGLTAHRVPRDLTPCTVTPPPQRLPPPASLPAQVVDSGDGSTAGWAGGSARARCTRARARMRRSPPLRACAFVVWGRARARVVMAGAALQGPGAPWGLTSLTLWKRWIEQVERGSELQDFSEPLAANVLRDSHRTTPDTTVAKVF